MNSELQARLRDGLAGASVMPSATGTRILVFSDWYLPGHKAGGLVSALSNLIELAGDDSDFSIFTRDRDFHEPRAYADVPLEQWVKCGKARVLYTGDFSLGHLRRRIFEVQPDLLYLNSFFSPLTVKTLCVRRLGLVPPIPVLLAPRGELASAALAIKRNRKRAYLRAARSCGLLRDVVWQASSVAERRQIRTNTGSDGVIRIVSDTPDSSFLALLQKGAAAAKTGGTARFIFLSRISRNKNLDFALRALSGARGQVEFEICGPVGDDGYWSECGRHVAAMPGNVRVRYRGAVSRKSVPLVLKEGHFLLLPTGGENFGYAILEALAAGCPAIISDQTQWRDLEKEGAGWTLPLDDAERWRDALDRCVAMDDRAYAAMSERARAYALDWVGSTPFRAEYRHLFEEAAQGLPGATNAAKNALQALWRVCETRKIHTSAAKAALILRRLRRG